MIRRATAFDWDQIISLSKECGLKTPESELLNDVFLVEVTQEGVISGFVWAGIVGSGKIAYGDYLTVSPKFKGAAYRLCKALVHELDLLEVREIHCQVRMDDVPEAYESYKLMNLLGMGILSSPFSLFVGDIKEGSGRWVKLRSRPN